MIKKNKKGNMQIDLFEVVPSDNNKDNNPIVMLCLPVTMENLLLLKSRAEVPIKPVKKENEKSLKLRANIYD